MFKPAEVHFSTYDTDEPRIDREDAFQNAFRACDATSYAVRRAEETGIAHTDPAQMERLTDASVNAYTHLCRVIEAFAAVEATRAVALVASLNRPAPPATPTLFTLKQDCEGWHLFGYEYGPVSDTDPNTDIYPVSIFGENKKERYDTLFGLMNDLPTALDWLRQDAVRSVCVLITDKDGRDAVRLLFENPNATYPEPSFEYVYPVAVALPVQPSDRNDSSPQEGGAR